MHGSIDVVVSLLRQSSWSSFIHFGAYCYKTVYCSDVKRCCIQNLATTLENLHREDLGDQFYQPVHTFVLNPKSITMEELYGGVDRLTMEWHDGLMGITIRNAVNVSCLLLDCTEPFSLCHAVLCEYVADDGFSHLLLYSIKTCVEFYTHLLQLLVLYSDIH